MLGYFKHLAAIAASAIAVPVVWALFKLGPIFVRQFTTPLRFLPGPPSEHWLHGNAHAIVKAETAVLQEAWMDRYGPTISYKGFFGIYRLFTMDTRALHHVLTHTSDFQKPAASRFHLARTIGNGIIVAEEDQHKQQRRVLNPAFGPAQIRALTSIFVEKSQNLRDLWSAEIAQSEIGQARIDVLSWLNRATLDIIGLAGFSHNFDALNPQEKPNELSQALNVIFNVTSTIHLFGFLQGFFPPARLIRTWQERKTAEAQNIWKMTTD